MTTSPPAPRPTSPHLSIYRWQLSMLMSILHRLTGLALYAGTLVLVVWLCTAAYRAPWFQDMHACLSSGLGRAMLIGWTAAFYYHLANGLRHLWWDMGRGFELSEVRSSGIAVLLFTALMTVATWWLALSEAPLF